MITIIPLVTLSAGDPLNPTLVPPGEPFSIDDTEGQLLIERQFAVAAQEQPAQASPQSDQLDAIVDAIAELPESAYGKDGKPSVKAIQNIIDVEITASQRDEAWLAFQKLSDE